MKQVIYTLLFMLVSTATLLAQKAVSGQILDADGGEPLIGASVIIPGTTTGTITDIDGKFSLNVPEETTELEVQYVGFETQRYSLDEFAAGPVMATAGAIGLESVVVSGVIDLVKDRETPVASSLIKAKEIQLKLGNREFPQVMQNTPSVYTTRNGGGYGDGRISVRGFDNTNVAVIINGQPVNDMENGRVFWSNWQGLGDIASGIEMQRGLGASKLVVPSVGGTINVVTKATGNVEGGFADVTIGNDGYLKTTVAYSTGVGKSGWSATALVGRWQGDGYVNFTEGEGYNYLFGVGYKPNEKHTFNLNFLGAGQWHNQRTSDVSIRDYKSFGNEQGDDFRKFNLDGGSLNGDEFSWRRNFYNKPLASFNWDYNIAENVRWSTSIYGSWGRGGGTGFRGRNFAINPFREDLTSAIARGAIAFTDEGGFRNRDGSVNFDAVQASNVDNTMPYTGSVELWEGQRIGSNGFSDDNVNSGVGIRRASINSHNWYGAISNVEFDVNRWTFGAGIDARYYEGLHYRALTDLIGLDGYYSTGNQNDPGRIIATTVDPSPFKNLNEASKIDYYNIGLVDWIGGNFLAEFKGDKFTAVLQGGVSNQGYTRKDFFDQPEYDVESDRENKLGGYVKGGANYNLNRQHNVFFNAGYIERQPFFDAIFPNFSNTINEDAENEEILSFELGYGLRSKYLDAKVNGYYTSWGNRFLSRTIEVDAGQDGTGNFVVDNLHTGVEVELVGKPIEDLRVLGMVSIGNWEYDGNSTARLFDEDQNFLEARSLFLDGVKVGDVAQTTFRIGAEYSFLKYLSVDANYNFFDNLYADFEVEDDDEFLTANNRGALELPNYGLLSAGLTVNPEFKNNTNLSFRFNVFNLLDEEYIAESNSNIHDLNDGYTRVDGISSQNSVWYGFGRTWSASLRYNF